MTDSTDTYKRGDTDEKNIHLRRSYFLLIIVLSTILLDDHDGREITGRAVCLPAEMDSICLSLGQFYNRMGVAAF